MDERDNTVKGRDIWESRVDMRQNKQTKAHNKIWLGYMRTGKSRKGKPNLVPRLEMFSIGDRYASQGDLITGRD